MALEALFHIANGVALVGWLALLAAPTQHLLRRLVPALVVLLLSGVYVALIAYALPRADGGFGALADVRALFAHDGALLAGWVHYLAFDLFVGAWIARDAAARRMNRLLLVPVLALTFLFGPVGYLAYRGLSVVTRPANAAPATKEGTA